MCRLLSLSLRTVVVLIGSLGCVSLTAGELSVEDFSFDGPLGSAGAAIEEIGVNHFKVTLGSAPTHPDWPNKLQFEIRRNARGNQLRLDVAFPHPRPRYRLNEYFHSWSYDGKDWRPIRWEDGRNPREDVLVFPEFERDRVVVGHQVPLSYEDLVEHIGRWKKHPHVKVHVVGQSLHKRDLYRLEITDFDAGPPVERRWVHYYANQHPGEHNSQWRMVGMIDWLLRDEAAEHRRRSINHFILMMSPDAPSQGWYRVNAEGFDMNRTYRAAGADADKQTHEAYLWQKDLEGLMSSPAPATTVWSMHTWGGIVEPIIQPGPEIGGAVAHWNFLKEIIERHDARRLIKPLKSRDGSPDVYWTGGPQKQFNITAVLCEGGGSLDTLEKNVYTGEVLMQSIVEYYHGLKPVE